MHDDAALLGLWERAVGQPPWRRDDVLLAADGHAAPLALAARNAALLACHSAWFGDRLDLHSRCPQCATTLEFSAACASLANGLGPAAATELQCLDIDGHRLDFRLPDRDDVAWAAQQPLDFEARLLQRCVVSAIASDAAVAPADLPEPVLAALSQRMEALDPGASLGFALECPACAAHWTALFDVGQALWRQLQARAEQVLLDVDALARQYGWTEPEVLALSPVRRAAYLQMASA